MKVLVIVKATRESETGVLPTTEQLTEMGKFNEELVKAGVMLAGEGLHASAKGKRMKFSERGKPKVTSGPFPNTDELVAGFWIWKVNSVDEAVDWLKRSPFDGGAEVEIRQIFEAEDFGENLTPELRQQEDRLREQVEKRKVS